MDRLEIEKILISTEKGEEILEYIETLEANQCKCDDEHHNHHNHHHDKDCDCGCHDNEEEWKEILSEQALPDISVNDWEKLLKDDTIFTEDSRIIIKRMRHVASPMTFAELADMFGYGALYYSTEIDKLSKKICEVLNITQFENTDLWQILLNGWINSDDTKIFALRPELYEAIGNVDFSNIPLRME